jgi:hypothetical protein
MLKHQDLVSHYVIKAKIKNKKKAPFDPTSGEKGNDTHNIQSGSFSFF